MVGSHRDRNKWEENKGDPADAAQTTTLFLRGVGTSLGRLSLADIDNIVDLSASQHDRLAQRWPLGKAYEVGYALTSGPEVAERLLDRCQVFDYLEKRVFYQWNKCLAA